VGTPVVGDVQRTNLAQSEPPCRLQGRPPTSSRAGCRRAAVLQHRRLEEPDQAPTPHPGDDMAADRLNEEASGVGGSSW
jgi:hypothetical protein